jgi:hypothetical protein
MAILDDPFAATSPPVARNRFALTLAGVRHVLNSMIAAAIARRERAARLEILQRLGRPEVVDVEPSTD